MDEIAEIARDEYGVTVTQVDTQEWKDASAKVAEKYKGGIDTEYWNAFMNRSHPDHSRNAAS